jgi:hypothetical protein
LEYWRTKFDIAASATETYFSRRWIGENIFNLSEADQLRNEREQFYDRVFIAELEKVAEVAENERGGIGPAGGDELAGDAAGTEAGELGGGLDLDLGGEAETPAPETGGEAGGGGGEEPMLLATPGKRDDEEYKYEKDGMTTTSKSKGKWYKPVGHDKRKSLAPKKKNYKAKYSDRSASRSKENVFPDFNSFLRSSKGMYEEKGSNYSDVINNTREVDRLLKELEKKDEN